MPKHARGRRPKLNPNATVCIFKVVLAGRKSIWRRLAIRSDQTLDDLHAVLFDAFDRFDEHLYSFHTQPLYARRGSGFNRDNVEYTSPVMIEEADAFDGHEVHDASKTAIAALNLQPGQRLYYLFDFGDSWWHDLTVEALGLPPEPSRKYPFVLEKHGESPPQYPDVNE